MTPNARRLVRYGLGIPAALFLLAFVVGMLALRASLPKLDGTITVPGLESPVAIERDAAGVPVIRGASRADVARATGYVHAQDRWFQMDLLRRTGAGELAALLGPGLLDADRRIRLHQFRARAVETLGSLDDSERALFQAYAEGANAALVAMRARPFEYLLLWQRPQPWRAEDSLLVIYAMWIDLQGLEARHEQRRGRIAAALPEPMYRFIVEPDPEWEAPLDDSRLPRMPMPAAEDYDLRKLDRALFERVDDPQQEDRRAGLEIGAQDAMVGSNNWAVAGARADGGALLANDMHLGLNVPNIWYRARFVVEPGELDVSGVSLPGLPAIIAGSNGQVAWGFTNSYGDFQDLIRLERGPNGDDSYLTPGGTRSFAMDIETLEVAGGGSESLAVRKTIWGPVIGDDGDGHGLALAWTAHRPGATDMALLALERASDLDEAADIIGGAGMPAQNVMIADRSGRIGWVLSGKLPRRDGIDASRPSAWHAQGAGWNGWLPALESPRLLDPPQGFAWSANARVAGGEAYARIGDGDYAPAARARQIRDRLAALDGATPPDMLAIQLDDRADYLANWQPILQQALLRAGEGEAATLVADWSGSAAVDDPGFRLVRDFERTVVNRAFAMLAAEAIARWPDFPWRAPQRFTEVAWRLIHERPEHLLDPRFADWDAWLAHVAVETVRKLPEGCASLDSCAWGKVNVAAIRHPISAGLPILSRLLDMPANALPGDWSTPRVQSPIFGASERFVISPGREGEGYLHMPGGQSGHPLSPYYRAGHEAWVQGDPTPFLPGPARHSLTLVPSGDEVK
ncbi:MAG: penicillin acylase family protein [Steroidobacteraceae bacterium]